MPVVEVTIGQAGVTVMHVATGLFRACLGVIFGALSMIPLAPAFAAFAGDGARGHSPWLASLVVIGMVLCAFAPTIRRAFGRGFLLVGASVFALPLASMLFYGRAVTDTVGATSPGSTAGIGTGIAGVIITGASAFIGFFFGAILLLIGLVLVLGGRREVVYVERVMDRVPPPPT